MLGPAFGDFAVWLISHPFGAATLLLLQISILAIAAHVLSRLVARFDASQTHGIWLVATLLLLLFAPIHVFRAGWKIRVANVRVTERPQADPINGQSPTTSSRTARVNPSSAASLKRLTVPGADSQTSEETTGNTKVPLDQGFFHDRIVADPDLSIKDAGSVLPLSGNATTVPDSFETDVNWPGATAMIMILYVLGWAFFALRLGYSYWYLRSIRKRSHLASSQTRANAAAIAKQIGTSRFIDVRVSDELTIPMMFGVISPVIVLPLGFDSWPSNDRTATLLHELTHVRRWDAFVRCISAISRVVFWFHPASHFLARRLSESCEWATDREVVSQLKTIGLDATHYAESLLLVVSRASQGPTRFNPAVAMAASNDIEQRVKLIIAAKPLRFRIVKRVTSFAIILLVMCAALSTIRFQIVNAQSPTDRGTITVEPATVSGPKTIQESSASVSGSPEDAAQFTAKVSSGDEDLLRRIKNATVLASADRDSVAAIVSVSGVVTDEQGRPVSNALVLLRESSTDRISREYRPFHDEKELHLRCVKDVLARTKTDENGEFKFREINAPGFKRTARTSNYQWRGNVVAAHDEAGIGFLNLKPKKEKRQQFNGASVSLRTTSTLEGTLVSSDQNPVAGALVSLNQLIESNNDGWANEQNMDLQASQLTPRMWTDSDGAFQFTNVPKSLIASFWVYDESSSGASFGMKTSPDVVVEDNAQLRFIQNKPVLNSPALVVTDPGHEVTGTVKNESGEPIANATVTFGSNILKSLTDSDGSIRYRLSQATLARYEKIQSSDESSKQPTTVPIYVAAQVERGHLPARIDFSVSDIRAEKQFEITQLEGVQVTGIVVDQAGKPLSGVSVKPTGSTSSVPGTSDENGDFTIVLPAGEHTLLFHSERDDLELPNRRESYDLAKNPQGGLTRSVSVSSGTSLTLKPVTVSRSKPLTVIVSLPDGSPARETNVVVREEVKRETRPGFPTVRVVDKSKPTLTNTLGRADVNIRGVPSDDAWVDFSLVRFADAQSESTAYNARVKVATAVDGVLTVVLAEAPTLEGRVLIDAKGIAGAVVSVGESREIQRKTSMGMMTSFSTSNHQRATTDQDGYYRLPISIGKRYSVSIQSIPGSSSRPGIGYTATASEPGITRVRDFAFYNGDQEIEGRVVDGDGKPLPDASVSVMRDTKVTPSFWVGHREKSQSKTDAEGRFRLVHVPAGTYRLRVSAKRSTDRSVRTPSTMTTATTGDTDLTIRLVGARVAKPTPRLKPLQIQKITPDQ